MTSMLGGRSGRATRTSSIALALALAGVALSACGGSDEVAEPVEAAALTGELCTLVPESVSTRWGLEVDDQGTSGDGDLATATCSMSGEVDGEPVTLSVRVTSYGGSDRDEALARAADELEDVCGRLEATGAGRFEDSGSGCLQRSPDDPPAERGEATDVRRLSSVRGVVRVDMVHRGPTHEIVAAEVVGVSTAILTGDDLAS